MTKYYIINWNYENGERGTGYFESKSEAKNEFEYLKNRVENLVVYRVKAGNLAKALKKINKQSNDLVQMWVG